MSYFEAKMHQIRFRLGLRPRPCWGSLQRSPRPPSCIKGALLLRGREEGEGKERKGEGRGRGGEGRELPRAPRMLGSVVQVTTSVAMVALFVTCEVSVV